MEPQVSDLDRLAEAVAQRLTSRPGAAAASPPPSLETQMLDRLAYSVVCRLAERMRPAWMAEGEDPGGPAAAPEKQPAKTSLEADPQLYRLAERLLSDAASFPKTPLEIEPIEI